MKLTFTVTVEGPWARDEVDREDMADYIATAVKCWAGGGHPDDWLWDISGVTVSDKYGNTARSERNDYQD